MSPKQTLPSVALHDVWTPERRQRAIAYAHDMRGTPHVDRIAIKGVGIDCVHFVSGVIIASGISESFRLPFYKPQWGIGRRNNVLERVTLDCLHCHVIDEREYLQFGDIAIFKVGRQSNHVGVILDGDLWHVRLGRMVEPEPVTIPLLQTLQAAIRIDATGLKKRPESLTIQDFHS